MRSANFYIVVFGLVCLFLSCGNHVVDKVKNQRKSYLDVIPLNNDIIEIDKNFDLGGSTIDISNKTLKITKGGVRNGIIKCNNCVIECENIPGALSGIKLIGKSENLIFNLNWFITDSKLSATNNFEALCNILAIGAKVYLTDFYPIATKNETEGYSAPYDIVIFGSGSEKSGLILKTKHKNVFYNFFQSDRGNSLELQGVSVVAENTYKNDQNFKKNQYFFLGSYYQSQFNPKAKPNVKYINVKNCKIVGAISIVGYGSSSDNQTIQQWSNENYIETINIENNEFQDVTAPFSISNLGYNTINIKGNSIKNLSETFFSAPISGIELEKYFPVLLKKRGDVSFVNNKLENNKVLPIESGRVLTPLVIKGGDGSLLFKDNELKNLLSNSTDAMVNTFYFSCTSYGKVLAENNSFYNVLGRGGINVTSSLVKQRGATTFTLKNNSFIVDKNAFVKIGLLKTINQNLSTLNDTDFACELIQTGDNKGFSKKHIITNNIFKIPYINKSSEIFDIQKMLFTDNTVEIDYYGTYGKEVSTSQNGVMFLARLRVQRDKNINAEDFIFVNNNIIIKESNLKDLGWIYYKEGTQMAVKNNIDQYYNFNSVEVNDRITANNMHIYYSLNDAIQQRYNTKLNGHNNSIGLIHRPAVGHNRQDTKLLDVNLEIDNYLACEDKGIFTLATPSIQRVKINLCNSNYINLMNYSYLSSLYPFKNIDLCKLKLNVEYVSKRNNSTERLSWKLILNNINRQFEISDVDNIQKRISPSSDYGKVNTVFNTNKQSKIHLEIVQGDGAKKDALIRLSGTQGLKDLKIVLTTD